MKQIFAFIIVTLALALPAQAACLSQAEARQVVASGQAKSLGSVAGQVGGEIVKAELCRQGWRVCLRPVCSKGWSGDQCHSQCQPLTLGYGFISGLFVERTVTVNQ